MGLSTPKLLKVQVNESKRYATKVAITIAFQHFL